MPNAPYKTTSTETGYLKGKWEFTGGVEANYNASKGSVSTPVSGYIYLDASGGGRIVTVGTTTTTYSAFGLDQYTSNLSGYRRAFNVDSNGGFTCVGFGCNGKTAQSSVSVNANATDLSTAVALLNQIRAALIANGICV